MDDLISRQAAIDAVNSLTYPSSLVDVKRKLVDLPSAYPERTAKFIRWISQQKTLDYISYTPHCKCSGCGTELLINNIKYCYACGARMEEQP